MARFTQQFPSPQREGVNSMAQDIKSKALDLALSQIEKQFGKGSIMKLGEQAIEADIRGDPDRLARA